MRLASLLLFLASLLVSPLSFSAACPVSSTATAIGSANSSNCTVTGSASTIQLNFITGFNSPSVLAASGGNNGTTVGAQRKLSFIKAAEILADSVSSSQIIIMDAAFTGLDCEAGSATLGSAGATVSLYNSSAPAGLINNTWYPVGLYNDISNSDQLSSAQDISGNYSKNGTGSDINSRFNSNIGQTGCLQSSNGWYYGFDAPPSNYIGFTTVLLHEATHGLGFASLTSAFTGAKNGGLDDIFSNHLYSKSNSSTWAVAGGLSNAQRAASAVSSTGLLWNGANVNAQAEGLLSAGYDDVDLSSSFTSGDRIQMYAPNPIEDGSSVSHFNTAASPNEIMEPQYTAGQLDLGLALYLLKDIGWTVTPTAANAVPAITAINQSTNEDIAAVVDASSWGSDTDGDTLTYSINSVCASNITCSINSDGTNLTMTPSANHNGGTHVITVSVSDGKGGSASDTFNLNVIAQNDDPVISGIPNQTIKVGEYKDLNVSTFAADVDGDGLTYSTTACGANLTCTFQDATTLRVTAGAGVGSTVSVTVKVDDSNSGINTDTFDVSIVTAVPSTTIEVGGSTHNDGGTFVLADTNAQINVNNGTGDYSYNLDYNSSDVTGLIAENTEGLTIGLPVTGEFAGDYTLTITDNGDGDVVTLTVTRPLRLSWSTKALLNGDVSQTLKVEGGAAGTVYSIVQSDSADLIFRDDSGTSVITVTGSSDAEAFNAALIHLDSVPVSAISSMDVTVQSSYEDVIEVGVKVYPSSQHHFTVKNSSNEALMGALAALNGNELLLAELNVLSSFSADVNGKFTVLLPDTSVLSVDDNYAMTVGATGYTSANLVLDSDNLDHGIVLTELVNGITINGDISIKGNQNLLQQPPVVTITYADETSDNLTVLVSLATQASFSIDVDLNAKSLGLLSISQAESVTVELDMSNISQSQNLDIFLLNNISVVASRPVDTGKAESAGGSLIWFNLFLFGVLSVRYLLRNRRVKVCI